MFSALRRIASRAIGRRRSRPYAPVLAAPDRAAIIREASALFGLPAEQIRQELAAHERLDQAKGHSQRFGEWKTLNIEESFLIRLMLKQRRPPVLIEIGTQFGRSTRRLIDTIADLGLRCEVHCYDIIDQVQHFTPGEATLHIEDLTGRFREVILERHPPGLIYLDAHPWALLHEVIGDLLKDTSGWAMAIHDCAPGLCNPVMTKDKSDPNVTSKEGVWERHVLADLLGVADPAGKALDSIDAATHSLRIFSTRHGLAVIVPRN